MKNRMGIVVLIVICALLGIALLFSQKRAAGDADRIVGYSNQWVNANLETEKYRQVNAELESDRGKQKDAFNNLTNLYREVSVNLEKSDTALKSAQQDIVQKDAKISDLEAQNQALDDRANELSASITNLTRQIIDTQTKLAASEGDKETLTKELQKLMDQKVDLERQLNDISVLKARVAKLREEMNIARRLDWMRRGVSATWQKKGGEQTMDLLKSTSPTADKASARPPTYDLNVEINNDGSVKVIPPLTNGAASTPPVAR
jgi:chromosome segregation ATPase